MLVIRGRGSDERKGSRLEGWVMERGGEGVEDGKMGGEK